MATGGQKEKSKGSGSQLRLDGVGGAAIFTGGALVGAAVLYGMKKLYDHFTTKDAEEPDLEKEALKKKEEECDMSDSEPSPRSMLNASPEFYHPEEQNPPESLMSVCDPLPQSEPTSPQSDGASSVLSVGSLHDNLFNYYINYVDIPEAEYQVAMTVVDDVKSSFRSVVEELMPNCSLGPMIDVGPASEGLAVVRSDYFQVGFQLSLGPKLWELVDAGQTLLSAHGYQMVKRTHLEFFSRGTSYFDRFLIGEYLSPVKIKSAFLNVTNRVSNWNCKHMVQSAVVGPEIKLIVHYGEERRPRTLTVEFIPAVQVLDTQVLAEPHSMCRSNSCYENLWMQSFRTEEIQLLTGWRPAPPAPPQAEHSTLVKELAEDGEDPEDVDKGDESTKVGVDRELKSESLTGEQNISIEGCQLMCLKILEAVRLNHPAQLRIVNSYMVRTIVTTLMTLEDGWSTEQLSERFLDTFKLLEEYLWARQLPHLFCPKRNLLEDCDSDSINQTREFIASVIGNNQFSTLLKTNY